MRMEKSRLLRLGNASRLDFCGDFGRAACELPRSVNSEYFFSFFCLFTAENDLKILPIWRSKNLPSLTFDAASIKNKNHLLDHHSLYITKLGLSTTGTILKPNRPVLRVVKLFCEYLFRNERGHIDAFANAATGRALFYVRPACDNCGCGGR